MQLHRSLPRILTRGSSHRGGWGRDSLEQAGFVCVTCGVVLCPFALGGAPLWSVAAAAALFLAALTLLALARHSPDRAVRIFPAALALSAAVLTSALQLLPMPPALLKVLAPANAQVLEQALSPLEGLLGTPGLWPAWRPVSLDPPATARAVLTLLTCLLGFTAAAQAAVFPTARTNLAKAISISALLIALTGFAHALAGSDALFGVFRFKQAAPPLLTPFGNPNHLAAFLIPGALFASCLAATADSRTQQLFWSLSWFILATAVVLSLSRAGLAAFVTGQILTAIALKKLSELEDAHTHASQTGPKLSVLALLAALSSVAAASAYLAADRLFAEWRSLAGDSGLADSKIALALRALPLIREHWLSGVGKDAFEPAFQRFAEEPALGRMTATHPENILADWLSGFGIPAGVLLLGGFAAALVIGFRRAGTSSLRWTALIAVFAVFLDDLLNFSLSFVGTAVPFFAAFAIGTAHRRQGLGLSAKAALLLLPAVLILMTGTFLMAGHDLRTDGEALQAALSSGSQNFRQAFADTVSRHPADYYPRLLAASKALTSGSTDAAVLLAGNAMALFPAHPAPHAAAALGLEAKGLFAQAATEWRLAQERGWAPAAARLARLFAEEKIGADRLSGIAPSDLNRGLEFADALRQARAFDLAASHLDALEQIHPRDDQTLKARAALAESRGDMALLLQMGTELTAMEDASGPLLSARALDALGRRGEAKALLEERLTRKNSAALRLRLAELHLRSGDSAEASAVLAGMPAALSLNDRIAMLRLKAWAAHRMKDFAGAAGFLQTASILRPRDLDLKLSLAGALIAAERFEAAMTELTQVRVLMSPRADAQKTSDPAGASLPASGRRRERLEQLTSAAERGLADKKARQNAAMLRALSSGTQGK